MTAWTGVVMVFHDVSERQRRQREIGQQLQELAEVDRRKDEFLAMLGPELRNPLAAVLERLVDDLLDVARIAMAPSTFSGNPSTCGSRRAGAGSARPSFVSSGLTRVPTQAPEPLTVHADPVRLEQVIANLLSNARKYTAPGGHVEVSHGDGGRPGDRCRPRYGRRY